MSRHNLTKTWLEAERKEHKLDPHKALQGLNKTFNRSYTVSRINEWKRGGSPGERGSRIPKEVREYMLKRSLLYFFKDSGFSAEQGVAKMSVSLMAKKLS